VKKITKNLLSKASKPTSYKPGKGNPKFLPKNKSTFIVKFKDDSNSRLTTFNQGFPILSFKKLFNHKI